MFSSRYAPMTENEQQQQQKSQRSAHQKSSRRTKSICSECPICFTTSNEIIQLPECQHLFCKACLVEYIQTQLSDFKVLKITCPQNDCNSLLNKSFLRKVLDDATFDRYQKLFLQKLDNRKSKTKYCPKAGCSRPFDPQPNSLYTKCQCDTQICNFCDHIWHEGKSCLEALDPEFQLYAQENNVKLCIMCKTVVMRVEGCKHITCPVCDYEWCWTCGREYKRGHDIVCVQEWSPEPPSKIIREYETKNLHDKVKLLLKPVMRFLMLLPVRMFLWAFWMTEAWWEMRSPERGTLEKIVIACCATTLSLLYIYAVGLMFYLFQKYPEDKRSFLTCLVIIIAIPWFIQGVINLYEIKKRKQRRWRTQDANKFAYTNAHKPELAGHDLEQKGTSMPINQDVTMMISNQTCEKSNIAFIQNHKRVKDANNHKRSLSQMDLSAFGWKGSPKNKHRIDFDPEP